MMHLLMRSLAISIGLLAATVAAAQELDGSAVKELAVAGLWDAQKDGYGYWMWNEDGTLCLRLENPTGDCADSGVWKIDGNFICYELGWWGQVYGQRDACISVVAHEGKPYEVLYQGAMVSTMMHFDLVE